MVQFALNNTGSANDKSLQERKMYKAQINNIFQSTFTGRTECFCEFMLCKYITAWKPCLHIPGLFHKSVSIV